MKTLAATLLGIAASIQSAQAFVLPRSISSSTKCFSTQYDIALPVSSASGPPPSSGGIIYDSGTVNSVGQCRQACLDAKPKPISPSPSSTNPTSPTRNQKQSDDEESKQDKAGREDGEKARCLAIAFAVDKTGFSGTCYLLNFDAGTVVKSAGTGGVAYYDMCPGVGNSAVPRSSSSSASDAKAKVATSAPYAVKASSGSLTVGGVVKATGASAVVVPASAASSSPVYASAPAPSPVYASASAPAPSPSPSAAGAPAIASAPAPAPAPASSSSSIPPKSTYSPTCYPDNYPTSRVLPGPNFNSPSMTTESCAQFCFAAGYALSGTEFGAECYCGNQTPSSVVTGGAGAGPVCDIVCVGNPGEICGGRNALSVVLTGAGVPVVAGSGAPAASPSSGAAPAPAPSSSAASSAQSAPALSSPAPSSASSTAPSTAAAASSTKTYSFTSTGCFTDNVANRTFPAISYATPTNMTIESCAQFCGDMNFAFFGTEYASECYCSHTRPGTAVSAACTMPCSGNPGEICGGSDALSVYALSQPAPAPAAPVVAASYLGCFNDNAPISRTLYSGPSYSDGSLMTTESCNSFCRAAGSKYAGTEYAGQCFCGDSIPSYGMVGATCNMPCSGNAQEICGGSNALSLWQL